MPRPAYMICSEGGADDKFTSLSSYFNVLEKIIIVKMPPLKPGQGIGANRSVVRFTAVWMRNDDDSEAQEYEHQLAIILPPNNKEITQPVQRIRFSTPFHKIFSPDLGILPFEGPGLLIVESRIRRVGDQEWSRQSFPIFVEEMAFDATLLGQVAEHNGKTEK